MAKYRRKRKRYVLIAILYLFLLAGIVFFLLLMNHATDAGENGLRSGRTSSGRGEDTVDAKERYRVSFGLAGVEEQADSGEPRREASMTTREERKKMMQKKARQIYHRDKKLLVLVNRERELKGNYDAELMYLFQCRIQASSLLYSDMTEMFSDAGNEGYEYYVASGYRSREYQQKLVDEDIQALMGQGIDYETAKERTYQETQPAGHSEHQTGLALDIQSGTCTQLTIEQEKEAANRWLRKNGWKYGFILRYPKDKENITAISYEPWHFRYVGRRAARFMHRNRLTLEEFYQVMEGTWAGN